MIPLLIPAYRPDEKLLRLVKDLAPSSDRPVVVVDDGNGPSFAPLFREVEACGAFVVAHAVNLGKGAALKSGFNFCLLRFPDMVGLVTADADGQHRPCDIENVAAGLRERPKHLVLGARAFAGEVPFRSRLGNGATRLIFAAVVGGLLRDTQTGLRGIPAGFLPALMAIPANRYEFEMEMLVRAKREGVAYLEVPIETVYIEGNQSSHFRPLVDSTLIYFILFRYLFSSLAGFTVDFAGFLGLQALGLGIAPSVYGARAASLAVNFTLNWKLVFHSSKPAWKTVPAYLLLALVSVFLSSAGTVFLAGHHWPVPLAKITVDLVLFILNFLVQRDIIFAERETARSVGAKG